MLAHYNTSAIVAVRDLHRAREFYEEVLGLELTETHSDKVVMRYRTGATNLFIHRSYEAQNRRVPAVVWSVGRELDAVINSLTAQQVIFDCKDGTVTNNGEPKVGGFKMVTFKDPEGNILQLFDF